MERIEAETTRTIQRLPGTEISFDEVVYDPEELERLKVRSYNETEGIAPKMIDERPHPWFGCYDCPICKNKGFVAYLRDGRYAERPCECQSIRRARMSAQRSGMAGYLDKTLEGYETDTPWRRDLKDKAMAYLEEGGTGWFAFLGQSGCGKTHICAAICNELIRQGRRVLYFQWLTNGRELMAQRFNETEYKRAFQPFVEADVLYIDDFWKSQEGKLTPTEIKTGLELLNLRYNNGKATILSSELMMKELRAADEATAGRLAERCGRYLCQVSKDTERNYRWRLSGNG